MPAMIDPLGLACTNVGFVYRTRGERISAIEDISFTASAGEIIGVVGPSGCGKSTLLRVLASLLIPSTGRVALGSEAAAAPCPTALVFQEHGLFPWMPVIDNVAFGLEMDGVPSAERRQRAGAMIDRVGLARFARSYPQELSVGMRQRAAIARAFVSRAPILLMDEPFGALDAQTKRILQDDLLDLLSLHPKLVVFVTHDIAEAVHLSDRVLVMTRRPGRIREEVRVHEPRPRARGYVEGGESSNLVRHIWDRLEPDVRRELEMTQ
jgi:NitT/TauT family transport system ATP-binding protein